MLFKVFSRHKKSPTSSKTTKPQTTQKMSLIKEEFVPVPPCQDLVSKLYNSPTEISSLLSQPKVLLQSTVQDEESLDAFLKSTHYNAQSAADLNIGALKQALTKMPVHERRFFYEHSLPYIVYLADKSTELLTGDKAIRYLKAYESGEVVLTQEQMACILANAFLSRWQVHSSQMLWFDRGLPSINYDEMFTERPNLVPKVAKCQMLINYFNRITQQLPTGKMTIQRKVLDDFPDFPNMNKPFRALRVERDGGIGDVKDTLEVDFANEFIGGASISYGCVQEEIKFSLCPELNVTRLICEKMEMQEAIQITGGEQFSKYTGYAFSLGYGGDHVDTNKDADGNVTTKTVAIDALIFHGIAPQFDRAMIDRELVKAYIGFYEPGDNLEPVSSGNWGCGAFGGDKRLKSILQWIAASAVGRDLVYFTFDKKIPLPDELIAFSEQLLQSGKTIGQVYNALLRVGENLKKAKETNESDLNAFTLVWDLLQ